MKEPTYVITYDVGTTGVKTCLFEIGEVVRLTAAAMRGYELYVLPDGGAEQEPAEWWEAMCASTREVLDASGMDPARISGVSFCSQMQGVVLVDKDGEPVRRAMSYMDQRAREELKKGLAHGPQIAGANVFKLLKSLQITGAVAASVKDPVWKYKWVQAHEPENFKRVHKWLDVKEFLICKMTGEFVMTQDSAFAALIYDIRKGKEGWSREMCDMLGVNMNHLAPIKQSTDKVGEITEKAASELGLKTGTAVFGGGGDASLIGVGAGSTALGDTHIYCGTSGWVSTVVDKSIVDASAMVAAIVGAQPERFNYFAELETAGKCLEWVKDHLALDEIDIDRDLEAAFHCFMLHYAMRENSYFTIETGGAPKNIDVPTVEEFIRQPDGGGYAGVALDFIKARATGEKIQMVLSVPNNGACPYFADGDVMELTCEIDGEGAHPLPVPEIPPMQLNLIRTIKLYENLTVEAILEKSYEKAVKALTIHPLINSYPIAKSLVDTYKERYKGYIGELS